jgi:hypothetical protein
MGTGLQDDEEGHARPAAADVPMHVELRHQKLR